MTMLLKHLLLTITLATTALLTVPTGGFAQSTASSDPDDAAIRKILDGLENAADTHDLAAFASFFVQSSDLYYQITTADNKVLLARGIDNMKKKVGAT